MFANVLHAQNNLHRTFTTIVNFWNMLTGHELVRAADETNAPDEEQVPYFIIPEIRLSLGQRTQLAETGFNQGTPFLLTHNGLSRPERHGIKVHPLINLCNIHRSSVQISQINTSDFKGIRDEETIAQMHELVQYELQFVYSADCPVDLMCFFGAHASKDLSQIKIRADLPGAKKWNPIRLPPGHEMTFNSSTFGLTLNEFDPIFHRLRRLAGQPSQTIEASLYSGVYDAIITLLPDASEYLQTASRQSVIGTPSLVDIEMRNLESTACEVPNLGSAMDDKVKDPINILQAKCAPALVEQLDKRMCGAEYTLCQLTGLPEHRQLAGEECENAKDQVLRAPELTEKKIDADDVLEARLSEYNKINIPKNPPSSPEKKLMSYAKMQVMSQQVQWNQQFFHLQEIFGGEFINSESKATLEDACETDMNCVICLGAQKEVFCVPCRHLCVCGECAMILKEQQIAAISANQFNDRIVPAEVMKCPMCRCRVSVLVYVNPSKNV